jgi:NAD(P)-dependent dehydrogenase (short-subunit alcohol dehydrogenase family)
LILHDRVALITGGKRIGVAIANDLIRRGMHVAMCYRRSREEAEAVAQTARSIGRRAAAIQADLTRAEDCASLVARTVSELGRLDVLINMASVYSQVDLDATDERVWDSVVDVDLKASFLCAKAALPHLRACGAGRIVNFTDWVAASGRPRYKGFLPYYVAKRGVIGLTEALSLELAAENILVNAIAPGPILPPAGTDEKELAAVEAATPLGRWGGEEEIVKAVAFLLESEYVTGETIRVDGGRHTK